MAYGMMRNIQLEGFQKRKNENADFSNSLAHETEALAFVVQVAENSIAQGDLNADSLDPSLELLMELSGEGLLEPFVLIVRSDQEIVQEYSGYRDQHRDNLVEFVWRHMIYDTE